MKEVKTRSLKRILIETVVFSMLLAALLIYTSDRGDKVASTDDQEVHTELSITESKTTSVF